MFSYINVSTVKYASVMNYVHKIVMLRNETNGNKKKIKKVK